MPNKEAIKAWVKELRDGKLNQCRGALRKKMGKKVGYCCLGVAHIAYRKATNNHDVKFITGNKSENRAASFLHPRVMKWLGLYEYNPEIDYCLSAIRANDCMRFSFSQIADLIERRYLNEP